MIIGTIIASHCGPGTVAVFSFGDDCAIYPLPKNKKRYDSLAGR